MKKLRLMSGLIFCMILWEHNSELITGKEGFMSEFSTILWVGNCVKELIEI